MNIFFSIIIGIIVGAIPFNYIYYKLLHNQISYDKLHVNSFSKSDVIIFLVFVFTKGFLSANLPVFLLNGGYEETVFSVITAMIFSFYLPVNKQYDIKSFVFLTGLLILFNPLLLIILTAVWLILLIYKRKRIFADIFSLVLIFILIITYSDILNENCYPPAESNLFFSVTFIIIFLLQLSVYFKEIKSLVNSTKKTENSENESN
jgi:glycerol-3-phosphate acyltransferase PlsY